MVSSLPAGSVRGSRDAKAPGGPRVARTTRHLSRTTAWRLRSSHTGPFLWPRSDRRDSGTIRSAAGPRRPD
jgi:hypothetical protein